jgi:hypothetical protein
MAREYVTIDISNAPELQRLAHAVRQSGKPYALKEGAQTVAVLLPAPKKGSTPRPPRTRVRRFTPTDPLFTIRGIIDGLGPTDMAANKDNYLAEAYAKKLR